MDNRGEAFILKHGTGSVSTSISHDTVGTFALHCRVYAASGLRRL